jgi:hypothetical protein
MRKTITYRPLEWFEEGLRNQQSYINNKRAEAERAMAEVRRTQEDYDRLAKLVAQAKAEGKTKLPIPTLNRASKR